MNRKWYVGIAVCILLIVISILVIYNQHNSELVEPKIIYEIAPEPIGNVEVNTGRSGSPTVTALPQSKASKQVEDNDQINVESNLEQAETATSVESVTVHDEKADVVEKHDLSASEGVTNDSDFEISDEELQRRLDTLAELERIHAEGEAWMEETSDEIAKELRPKSIAERQRYLAEMRSGLEADEEPETVDWVIDNLIRAMNERGVYFE